MRRVIHIESKGNPSAVSKGNYGLMQIRIGTARAMGYRGTEQGLLDPDTNMTYAVKYLAGAYRAAGCSEGRAISYYQRGYYGAPRAQCPTSAPSTTQIAERPEEEILVERPRARAARAAVAARVHPEPAAPPSGDILKPKPVQTQIISRPSKAAAVAKAEPVSAPAVPTLASASAVPVQMRPKPAVELTGSIEPARASPPGVLTLQDLLAQPMTRSKLTPAPPQPIAARAPETVPVPRAKPAEKTTARQAVAALDPDVVPIPVAKPELATAQETQAKPAHNRTRKPVRSTRRGREEPSLLAALKKLITPDRPSRRAVTRR